MPSSIPRISKSSTLKLCLLADVSAQLPEHKWLIEQIWLAGGVGILGGAPKMCKTFLAAELAIATATGNPLLGKFKTHIKGPVVFYGAEDALPGLRVRFDGLANANNFKIDRNLPIYLVDEPRINLELQADLSRLRRAIENVRPRLLVLDPFVRIARIDENSANEVAGVLGSLRDIQRDYDLAILVVHHARKSPAAHINQAYRGSSDFGAWSDSNLFLSRKKKNMLLLSLEHRSAAAPDPITLKLEQEPEPHLVLVDAKQDSVTHNNVLASQILRHLAESSLPLTTAVLRELLQRRKADVVDALEKLKADGKVNRTSTGWTLMGTEN